LDGNCRKNNVQWKHEVNYEPRVHLGLTSSARKEGRELYSVDGQAHRAERSYLKVKSTPFDGSFDYQPEAAAKWAFQAKNKDLSHEGTLTWDREALNIDSKTTHKSKPLATIRSRITRSDKSTFDLDCPLASANFEASPFAQTRSAKLNLNAKRQNFRHEASVEYQPRKSFKFTTDNKKDQRSVLKIDSLVAKDAKSTFSFKTDAKEGTFEFDPKSRQQKAARWTLKTEKYDHDADVQYDSNERQFDLNSATKRSGRNVFDIKTRVARNAESNLNLKTEEWELNAIAQPHLTVRNVKVNLNGKQLAHETRYQWQPRTSYSLDSKTDRNGRKVMEISSTVEPKGKSTLKVILEGGEARFETVPSGPARSAKWNIRSKRNDWTHEADVKADQRQVTLTSKTAQKGQKIANIDADLNREKSTLRIETADHEGRLEVSPYQKVKVAKFTFKTPRSPLR
jgi:hypothetical protein